MFRYLICIFTFCLLNFSCSHLEKNKDAAVINPIAPDPNWISPDVSSLIQRKVSAETPSIEAEFKNLKTADELDSLITKIDKNYAAVPDSEKLLALEISLLKPFRGYNTILNQISIGVVGTDFLTLISGIDTSPWKKNSVIDSYLNDNTVLRFKSRDDLQLHLLQEFVPRLHNSFTIIQALALSSTKSLKSELCSFSCDSKKMIAPIIALRNLALINAKVGFQFSYKYTALFDIRKSDSKEKPNVENTSSFETTFLIATKHSNFELYSAIKNTPVLSIVPNYSKWLQYTKKWYDAYTTLMSAETNNTSLAQAFKPNHQFVHQNRPILVNLAAFFDRPNPDLKNFLAHSFDEKTKAPIGWDLDSYKAIFPNLNSQEDVLFHINALISYFPGGLPFPLSLVFNVTAPTPVKTKTKKK